MRVEPIFGKSQLRSEPDLCFVLMPFMPHFAPVFIDHIRKVCNKLNLRCLRADDIFSNSSIIDDIWCSIVKSRVIVADLTSKNPNVFYEIGIAHTIGKPVILITQDIEDIPFDLRHIRNIIYKFTPRGMEEFESSLYNTINHILENPFLSLEQFRSDLVSDSFPETSSLKAYPDDYIKNFVFDRLNENFLRNNALELCFFRKIADDMFLDVLLQEKNPSLKSSISKFIEKYTLPISEAIMISLLSEESQVARPAVKAAYQLSVDGYFSSKILEITSNNSSWEVRKDAVFRIVKLNDLHSLETLAQFTNPKYDPEYHLTIMSMRNYIESLMGDNKLINGDIMTAISIIDHHFTNSNISPHNKDLLSQTLTRLLELAK